MIVIIIISGIIGYLFIALATAIVMKKVTNLPNDDIGLFGLIWFVTIPAGILQKMSCIMGNIAEYFANNLKG